MLKTTFCLLIFLISTLGLAQDLQGFGDAYVFNPDNIECLSDSDRTAIITMLKQNTTTLKEQGLLIPTQRGSSPLFTWPVQQASGFSYNDIWSISNYVDHNSSFPNQLSDFDCGNRTYDTTGGYNHQGIDIFTWPFSWKQLDDDQSEIVAGAAGQIIAKGDGSYDRNCAFNSDSWNAVYVQHSDGSVAWYGHMKSGSLTTKGVGQMVAQGEYLGIVGSSGNSTGPHLHFEVYQDNSYTNLIDPYTGPCNGLNANSWWQSQRPYLNPNINAALTHSAPPVFPACPTTETTNESDQFDVNDTVYFAIYMRDQMNGTSVNLKIIQPNDVPLYDWNFDFTADYYASWWYWSATLATAGQWKWEASYNGQVETHLFDVGFLSVEENVFEETLVYPNPVESSLFIKSNSFISNLMVTDITGKIVFEIQDNVTSISKVNMSDLSSGVYFVILESDQNEEKIVKLIKE